MPYLLAVFAVVVPVLLVVQTVRGRVRVQCCATDAAHDLRMRDAAQPPAGTSAS